MGKKTYRGCSTLLSGKRIDLFYVVLIGSSNYSVKKKKAKKKNWMKPWRAWKLSLNKAKLYISMMVEEAAFTLETCHVYSSDFGVPANCALGCHYICTWLLLFARTVWETYFWLAIEPQHQSFLTFPCSAQILLVFECLHSELQEWTWTSLNQLR